jgi:hypothetical protein
LIDVDLNRRLPSGNKVRAGLKISLQSDLLDFVSAGDADLNRRNECSPDVCLDRLEGRTEHLARLLGAVVALQTKYEVNFPDRADRPARLKAALGDAAFDQAFEKGTLLTLPEAIALAIID